MQQEQFDYLWQEYYDNCLSVISSTEEKAKELKTEVEEGFKAYITGVMIGGLTAFKHVGKELELDINKLNSFVEDVLGGTEEHGAGDESN